MSNLIKSYNLINENQLSIEKYQTRMLYSHLLAERPDCTSVCDVVCDRICDRICDTVCDQICDSVCDQICDMICDQITCDSFCGIIMGPED